MVRGLNVSATAVLRLDRATLVVNGPTPFRADGQVRLRCLLACPRVAFCCRYRPSCHGVHLAAGLTPASAQLSPLCVAQVLLSDTGLRLNMSAPLLVSGTGLVSALSSLFPLPLPLPPGHSPPEALRQPHLFLVVPRRCN